MNTDTSHAPVMSLKDWLITLIITAIPLVGVIMLFVWAFSAGENPNKSNWAKASLIVIAIVVLLYIFIFAAFIGALLSSFGTSYE